jgi:hypothetical protein
MEEAMTQMTHLSKIVAQSMVRQVLLYFILAKICHSYGVFPQAWAQAVRVDSTILILHSGNYEVIGIRHRKTQTLYVSDIIEPPKCNNPTYGRLQVGIYISAIQDAMDRARQMEESEMQQPDRGDDSPDNGKGSGEKNDHADGKSHGKYQDDHGHRRSGDHEGDDSRGEQWAGPSQSGSGRKVVDAGEMAAREVCFSVYCFIVRCLTP